MFYYVLPRYVNLFEDFFFLPYFFFLFLSFIPLYFPPFLSSCLSSLLFKKKLYSISLKQQVCYWYSTIFETSISQGLIFVKILFFLNTCSPAHLNFPRETSKYDCQNKQGQNSLLVSKPYVPFNQAAVIWRLGPLASELGSCSESFAGNHPWLSSKAQLVKSACCLSDI